MTAGQQLYGHGAQFPPLRLTFAQWRNRRRIVRGFHGEWDEKWSKVLAHTGSLDQFAYGTSTPSDWYPGARGSDGPLQRCQINTPTTGTITIDVDDEAAFLATRTAQLTGRQDAISTRGDRFHILIDARAVPPGAWPVQGPIPGADIKANGWVPVPGSWHYSGEMYAPVIHPGGWVRVVHGTPGLIAAIKTDREEHRAASEGASGGGHSGGGQGGGHDGEVAAKVMSMVLRGLTKEECYAEWLKIAIPHDPSWPFERDDFERHYGDETRGALAKARHQPATRQPGARQPGARRPGVRS